MERGTLLGGALAGFALSTMTFVLLDEPPVPTPTPDPRLLARLDHAVELLERIERRELSEPVLTAAAPARRSVPAADVHDLTLEQLAAEVRALRDAVDRQQRQRQVQGVVPAMMDAGAVHAAIQLGSQDPDRLHSQLALMPADEVLRRFGRPSGVDTDHGYWTYVADGGGELTIFFAGNLVSDTNARVRDVR